MEVSEAFLTALKDALQDALRLDFPQVAPLTIPQLPLRMPMGETRLHRVEHDAAKPQGAFPVSTYCFLLVGETSVVVRGSIDIRAINKAVKREEPFTIKLYIQPRYLDFEKRGWKDWKKRVVIEYDPSIEEIVQRKWRRRFTYEISLPTYYNIVNLLARAICRRMGHYYAICMSIIRSLLRLDLGVYHLVYSADVRLPAQTPVKVVRFMCRGSVPTTPMGCLVVTWELGGALVQLARWFPPAAAIVNAIKRYMPRIIAEWIRASGFRLKAWKETRASTGVYAQHIFSLPLLGTPWARK